MAIELSVGDIIVAKDTSMLLKIQPGKKWTVEKFGALDHVPYYVLRRCSSKGTKFKDKLRHYIEAVDAEIVAGHITKETP